MNKIERFRAMLRGEAVDHVPAGFWFHFPPAYHGGEPMAQRHLAYYRATDLDVMKVMNDTGYAPIGTLRVQAPEDWLKLEPTPLTDPLFRSHIDGLARISAAIGHEVPIMTTAFNPYNQAVAILRASDPSGQRTSAQARDLLLEHARQAPEPLLRALGIMADDLAAYFKACIIEGGIHGIYYSAQGGERELMTDAEHARLVKAFDLQVLREVNSVAEFVVGHFCGRGLSLARFADYPVHLANWAYQADNLGLDEGKALFGGISILGGLDERGPLVYGPGAALRAEIAQALETMGTRGFMLGAGCTVPGDVDVDNLRDARKVVAALSAA